MPMIWFALATYQSATGLRAAIKVGDSFYDLAEAATAHGQTGATGATGDLSAILRDWEARKDSLFALARALADGAKAPALEAPALRAPFEPRRIFAAASNFIEHADEMKTKLAAKAVVRTKLVSRRVCTKVRNSKCVASKIDPGRHLPSQHLCANRPGGVQKRD